MVLTGVSVSADSTGTHSLYTTYQDYEIMFHVSTLLPYTPKQTENGNFPRSFSVGPWEGTVGSGGVRTHRGPQALPPDKAGTPIQERLSH